MSDPSVSSARTAQEPISFANCKHCGQQLVSQAQYCMTCGFFVGVETATTDRAVLMATYKEASIALRASLQVWWIVLTLGTIPIVFAVGDTLGRLGFVAVELFFLLTLTGSAFRRWISLYRAKSDLELEEADAVKKHLENHQPGPRD